MKIHIYHHIVQEDCEVLTLLKVINEKLDRLLSNSDEEAIQRIADKVEAITEDVKSTIS